MWRAYPILKWLLAASTTVLILTQLGNWISAILAERPGSRELQFFLTISPLILLMFVVITFGAS
jgi:hypothetical protein